MIPERLRRAFESSANRRVDWESVEIKARARALAVVKQLEFGESLARRAPTMHALEYLRSLRVAGVDARTAMQLVEGQTHASGVPTLREYLDSVERQLAQALTRIRGTEPQNPPRGSLDPDEDGSDSAAELARATRAFVAARNAARP